MYTRDCVPGTILYLLMNLLNDIGGLQLIPRDLKDNGVAAMLDDRTFCFVIHHGHHTVVFSDLQGLVANHLYAA